MARATAKAPAAIESGTAGGSGAAAEPSGAAIKMTQTSAAAPPVLTTAAEAWTVADAASPAFARLTLEREEAVLLDVDGVGAHEVDGAVQPAALGPPAGAALAAAEVAIVGVDVDGDGRFRAYTMT